MKNTHYKYSVKVILCVASLSALSGTVLATQNMNVAPNCLAALIVQNALAGKSIPITQCGITVTDKKAHLEKDLDCSADELAATGAAVVLHHASLDLNGKSIRYKDQNSQSTGILMQYGAEVFNSKEEGRIQGFHTGIKVEENNNNLCNLTITNTTYGINVSSDYNQLAQIKIKNIGGIAEQNTELLVAEGKGIITNGSYNKLVDNTLHTIGYVADVHDTEVNSMFIYGGGIEVNGDHNFMQNQTIENIYAHAFSRLNAQAAVFGIQVSGSYNQIESSQIKKLHSSGTRIEYAGLQTGGTAIGVRLSNLPEQEGHNQLNASTISDILAEGKKIDQTGIAKDITAEAYGIQAYYYAQQVTHNKVAKVDALAESMQFTVGIRAVDSDHYIAHNTSLQHGLRLQPSHLSKPTVFGISIDATNTRVENNTVENNNGFGISTSIVSSLNNIHFNKSLHNTLYDFIEQTHEDSPHACHNDWSNNKLVNATFYPEFCFASN